MRIFDVIGKAPNGKSAWRRQSASPPDPGPSADPGISRDHGGANASRRTDVMNQSKEPANSNGFQAARMFEQNRNVTLRGREIADEQRERARSLGKGVAKCNSTVDRKHIVNTAFNSPHGPIGKSPQPKNHGKSHLRGQPRIKLEANDRSFVNCRHAVGGERHLDPLQQYDPRFRRAQRFGRLWGREGQSLRPYRGACSTWLARICCDRPRQRQFHTDRAGAPTPRPTGTYRNPEAHIR